MKVSVIMPVYNVENYLGKSIGSIMGQKFDDFELIAINDASTDNSLKKLYELQKIYGKKLKIINLEQNSRQGAARNRGLVAAKGDYIVFVDSDDWIDDNMLGDMYSSIENSQSDMAGTACYVMEWLSGDKKIIDCGSDRILNEFSGKMFSKELRNKALFCLGGTWRNIYKRKIIIDNQIFFPEKVSYEDNFFVSLYLCYVKKYVCCNKPYYHYVQHENSTIHRKDDTQLHRIIVEKMLLSEVKKRGLYEELREGYEIMAVQRWYVNTLGIVYKYFPTRSNKIAYNISKEFRKYFPDFKENRYYKKEISRIDRLKIRALEFNPKALGILYLLKRG